MAQRFQLKLNSYYSHENGSNNGGSTSPEPQRDCEPPAVVLILDRSIDLYAPLVHEPTYQAMVYDLVDLEDGNKYVYTTKANDGQLKQVEAELSEKADPLWQRLRHEHVGSVARILAERLESLIEESTGIKALNSGSVLAELPEFKKMQSSELVTQMSAGSGSPVGRMSIETRLIALLDDTEL
ncbi:syntaxin binding protein 1, partial [Coemansia sp. RSA 2607]